MIVTEADRVILFIEYYASQDYLRYTKLRIPVLTVICEEVTVSFGRIVKISKVLITKFKFVNGF